MSRRSPETTETASSTPHQVEDDVDDTDPCDTCNIIDEAILNTLSLPARQRLVSDGHFDCCRYMRMRNRVWGPGQRKEQSTGAVATTMRCGRRSSTAAAAVAQGAGCDGGSSTTWLKKAFNTPTSSLVLCERVAWPTVRPSRFSHAPLRRGCHEPGCCYCGAPCFQYRTEEVERTMRRIQKLLAARHTAARTDVMVVSGVGV